MYKWKTLDTVLDMLGFSRQRLDQEGDIEYGYQRLTHIWINVKKLQFIHTVNGAGSKTAKIIKKAMLTTLT